MKYDEDFYNKQPYLGRYLTIPMFVLVLAFAGWLGWLTATGSRFTTLALAGLILNVFFLATVFMSINMKSFWERRVKKSPVAEREFSQYVRASADYYGFEPVGSMEFKKKS
jgi:hypothetical protein